METTILAHTGEIQLHFLAVKPTLAEAQERVDDLAELVEAEMEDAVYSSQGESLEEVVLLNLGIRHLTLAAAESCTGGLLGAAADGGSGKFAVLSGWGGGLFGCFEDQLRGSSRGDDRGVRTGERAGGACAGGGNSSANGGFSGGGDYRDRRAYAGDRAGRREADRAGLYCAGRRIGDAGEGDGDSR